MIREYHKRISQYVLPEKVPSTFVILILVKDEVLQPCNPSPCGANAVCKELNGAGSCTCLPEYYGDPYSGCRPECVTNNDCPSDRACLNNKCKDPCPGVCGQNALCHATKHTPSCTCLEGYTGNPFSACHEPPPPPSKNGSKMFFFPQRTIVKLNFLHIYSEQNIQPCIPSPCGPNSQCREVDNHAVCSCLPNYIGSAPNCRPECVVSSECAQDKACLNKKCQDPCPGTCGQNARCQVVSHNPICSCSPDFTGDPFVRCVPKISKIYTFS